MGDRTHVSLSLPTQHLAGVRALLPGELEDAESVHGALHDGPPAPDDITTFGFEDVNYGDLPFLPTLQEHGIPYDASWSSGDEYPPGDEYFRISPEGKTQFITHSEGGENPSIHALMALVDNPQQLVTFIRNHHARNVPLPWENQATYRKQFLVRRAVGILP